MNTSLLDLVSRIKHKLHDFYRGNNISGFNVESHGEQDDLHEGKFVEIVLGVYDSLEALKRDWLSGGWREIVLAVSGKHSAHYTPDYENREEIEIRVPRQKLNVVTIPDRKIDLSYDGSGRQFFSFSYANSSPDYFEKDSNGNIIQDKDYFFRANIENVVRGIYGNKNLDIKSVEYLKIVMPEEDTSGGSNTNIMTQSPFFYEYFGARVPVVNSSYNVVGHGWVTYGTFRLYDEFNLSDWFFPMHPVANTNVSLGIAPTHSYNTFHQVASIFVSNIYNKALWVRYGELPPRNDSYNKYSDIYGTAPTHNNSLSNQSRYTFSTFLLSSLTVYYKDQFHPNNINSLIQNLSWPNINNPKLFRNFVYGLGNTYALYWGYLEPNLDYVNSTVIYFNHESWGGNFAGSGFINTSPIEWTFIERPYMLNFGHNVVNRGEDWTISIGLPYPSHSEPLGYYIVRRLYLGHDVNSYPSNYYDGNYGRYNINNHYSAYFGEKNSQEILPLYLPHSRTKVQTGLLVTTKYRSSLLPHGWTPYIRGYQAQMGQYTKPNTYYISNSTQASASIDNAIDSFVILDSTWLYHLRINNPKIRNSWIHWIGHQDYFFFLPTSKPINLAFKYITDYETQVSESLRSRYRAPVIPVNTPIIYLRTAWLNYRNVTRLITEDGNPEYGESVSFVNQERGLFINQSAREAPNTTTPNDYREYLSILNYYPNVTFYVNSVYILQRVLKPNTIYKPQIGDFVYTIDNFNLAAFDNILEKVYFESLGDVIGDGFKIYPPKYRTILYNAFLSLYRNMPNSHYPFEDYLPPNVTNFNFSPLYFLGRRVYYPYTINKQKVLFYPVNILPHLQTPLSYVIKAFIYHLPASYATSGLVGEYIGYSLDINNPYLGGWHALLFPPTGVLEYTSSLPYVLTNIQELANLHDSVVKSYTVYNQEYDVPDWGHVSYKLHTMQYFSMFKLRIWPRPFMMYYTPTANTPNPVYQIRSMVKYEHKTFKVKKARFKILKDSVRKFLAIFYYNIIPRNDINITRNSPMVIKGKSTNNLFSSALCFYITQQGKYTVSAFIKSNETKIEPIVPKLKTSKQKIIDIASYIKSQLKNGKQPNAVYEDIVSMKLISREDLENIETLDFLHPVETGVKLGAGYWEIQNAIAINSNGEIMDFSKTQEQSKFINYVNDFPEQVYDSFEKDEHYIDIHLIENIKYKIGYSSSLYFKYKNHKNLNNFIGSEVKIDGRSYELREDTIASVGWWVHGSNVQKSYSYIHSLKQPEMINNNNQIGTFTEPREAYMVIQNKDATIWMPQYNKVLDLQKRTVFYNNIRKTTRRMMDVFLKDRFGIENSIDLGPADIRPTKRFVNVELYGHDRESEPLFLGNDPYNNNSFVALFFDDSDGSITVDNPLAGFYHMNTSSVFFGNTWNLLNIGYAHGKPQKEYEDLIVSEGTPNQTTKIPPTVLLPTIAYSYSIGGDNPYANRPTYNLNSMFSIVTMPRIPMILNQIFFTDELRGFKIKKIPDTLKFTQVFDPIEHNQEGVTSNNVAAQTFYQLHYYNNAIIDIDNITDYDRIYGRVIFPFYYEQAVPGYPSYSYVWVKPISDDNGGIKRALTYYLYGPGQNQSKFLFYKKPFILSFYDIEKMSKINRASQDYDLNENTFIIPTTALVEAKVDSELTINYLCGNFVPPINIFDSDLVETNFSGDAIRNKAVYKSEVGHGYSLQNIYNAAKLKNLSSIIWGLPPNGNFVGSSWFVQSYWPTIFPDNMGELDVAYFGDNAINNKFLAKADLRTLIKHLSPDEWWFIGSNILIDTMSDIRFSADTRALHYTFGQPSNYYILESVAANNIVYRGENIFSLFAPPYNNNVMAFMPFYKAIEPPTPEEIGLSGPFSWLFALAVYSLLGVKNIYSNLTLDFSNTSLYFRGVIADENNGQPRPYNINIANELLGIPQYRILTHYFSAPGFLHYFYALYNKIDTRNIPFNIENIVQNDQSVIETTRALYTYSTYPSYRTKLGVIDSKVTIGANPIYVHDLNYVASVDYPHEIRDNSGVVGEADSYGSIPLMSSLIYPKLLHYNGMPHGGHSILSKIVNEYYLYNDLNKTRTKFVFYKKRGKKIKIFFGKKARVSAGITFLGSNTTNSYYLGGTGTIIGRNFSSYLDRFYGEYVLPTGLASIECSGEPSFRLTPYQGPNQVFYTAFDSFPKMPTRMPSNPNISMTGNNTADFPIWDSTSPYNRNVYFITSFGFLFEPFKNYHLVDINTNFFGMYGPSIYSSPELLANLWPTYFNIEIRDNYFNINNMNMNNIIKRIYLLDYTNSVFGQGHNILRQKMKDIINSNSYLFGQTLAILYPDNGHTGSSISSIDFGLCKVTNVDIGGIYTCSREFIPTVQNLSSRNYSGLIPSPILPRFWAFYVHPFSPTYSSNRNKLTNGIFSIKQLIFGYRMGVNTFNSYNPELRAFLFKNNSYITTVAYNQSDTADINDRYKVILPLSRIYEQRQPTYILLRKDYVPTYAAWEHNWQNNHLLSLIRDEFKDTIFYLVSPYPAYHTGIAPYNIRFPSISGEIDFYTVSQQFSGMELSIRYRWYPPNLWDEQGTSQSDPTVGAIYSIPAIHPTVLYSIIIHKDIKLYHKDPAQEPPMPLGLAGPMLGALVVAAHNAGNLHPLLIPFNSYMRMHVVGSAQLVHAISFFSLSKMSMDIFYPKPIYTIDLTNYISGQSDRAILSTVDLRNFTGVYKYSTAPLEATPQRVTIQDKFHTFDWLSAKLKNASRQLLVEGRRPSNLPALGWGELIYHTAYQPYFTKIWSYKNMLASDNGYTGYAISPKAHIMTVGGTPEYESTIADLLFSTAFLHKAEVDGNTRLYSFPLVHPNYVLTDTPDYMLMPEPFYTGAPMYLIAEAKIKIKNKDTNEEKDIIVKFNRKNLGFRILGDDKEMYWEDLYQNLCFPQCSYTLNKVDEEPFDRHQTKYHGVTNGGVWASLVPYPQVKAL